MCGVASPGLTTVETRCARRERRAPGAASAGAGGGGGAGVAPVEATLGAARREGEELRVRQQVEEGAAAQQADALAIAQQRDARHQRGEGGQRKAAAPAPG